VVFYFRALNANWEEKLSKQFGDKEVSHTNFGGEPKMRFVSTALVLMAIALMMLAMTLVNTTSGP
jgi:hypothetical protein